MSTLNAGETLQPFKPLRNNLIFDSSGNLVGIQNDRANGTDLRLNGGSAGTFSSLVVQAAGTLELYNTTDQTTNYERVSQYWATNVYYLNMQRSGTGSNRELRIGNTAVSYIRFVPTASYIRLGNGGGNTSDTSTLSNLSEWGLNASSGTQTPVALSPTINQSGTAGYTALDINPTETTTGSGAKLLQRWAVGGTVRGVVTNLGVFNFAGMAVSSDGAIGFLSSTALGTAGLDITLNRDAADTLALRRGPNAQTFRAYNTYTDGSNYRRWNLSWNTTTAIMQVVGAGTGTNGNLAVGSAALATTDTVGYFMIPSCAGAPTGVPADIPAGQVALHFDSTNNKLYVYDGGWLSTAALT